jgi:hypothetical protein
MLKIAMANFDGAVVALLHFCVHFHLPPRGDIFRGRKLYDGVRVEVCTAELTADRRWTISILTSETFCLCYILYVTGDLAMTVSV